MAADDRLEAVRRAIEQLQEYAEASAEPARSRLRYQLDAVRRDEARARRVLAGAADEADASLRRLDTRVAIAADAATAELAADRGTFERAVESLLDGWDLATERLQAKAATGSVGSREAAEAAVSELRAMRNDVAASLEAGRADVAGAWRERRLELAVVADEVSRRIDELAERVEVKHVTKGETMDTTTDRSGLRSWSVDRGRSIVEFAAKGFWGLSTATGRFSRFEGAYTIRPESREIELDVEADSLDTGIGLRDKHLRGVDFFDVEEHPHVRFRATKVTEKGDGLLRVDGELEAAGASVPVSFDATEREVGDELELEATAVLDQHLLGMTHNPLGMVRRPATLHVKARLVPVAA